MVYFRIKHTIFMLPQETAEAVGMVVYIHFEALRETFLCLAESAERLWKTPPTLSVISVISVIIKHPSRTPISIKTYVNNILYLYNIYY